LPSAGERILWSSERLGPFDAARIGSRVIFAPEHGLLIFSPWKTASSTMGLRLREVDRWPYPRFYHFASRLNRIVHHHITCADFLVYPEASLTLLKASFVRNPYDRVYSGFLQLQRDFEQQPRMAFESDWVRRHVMRQLADNFAQVASSGFDVDAWFASVRDEQIFETGRNSSFPLHPAHYWTHVGSEPFVDVVGRVESFDTDFEALLTRCGLEGLPRVDANVSEIAEEASGSGYRHARRLSRRTLDKINVLFRRDFELFGYAMI
jgi:hypothetical protein